MSYTEARSHFEQGRLNTVDKGVIEMLDGLNHSCEEITVTTPLNHKVKVRMKNLGRDVWDTTLVYVRQPHRVGKFKGWDQVIQAATKKAIEIADAPPLPIWSFAWAMTQNARALIQTTNLYLRPRAPSPPPASCLGDTPKPKSKNRCSAPIPSTRLLLVVLIADAERITAEGIDSEAVLAAYPSFC